MREIPRMKESDPGAVPGASTQLTADSAKGIGATTEHCSVEIAKVLEGKPAGAPGSTGAGAVAEGGPEVSVGPPEAPPDGLPVLAFDTVGDTKPAALAMMPCGHTIDHRDGQGICSRCGALSDTKPAGPPRAVARFCGECSKYGDETALDYRAPEGALCAFHAADRKRKRDLEALGAQAAFATEAKRVDGTVCLSLSRDEAWLLLAALLRALRGGR